MRRTSSWILAILFLCLVPEGWAEQAPAVASKIVDAGNTVCPVSGDKVSSKVGYVYQGKQYHFCCPACIKKFQRDPKKYLARMVAGKFDKEMQH